MIEERWLTVEEIAKQMKVTDQTVRRWLKSGELVGTNFGGRTGYRIREADANAFLERKTGKAAA